MLLVTLAVVLLTAESRTMSGPLTITTEAPMYYYKAGVVEFAVNDTYKESWSVSEATDKMASNLRGFEVILKTAYQEGVQIIVFPEDAIAGQNVL